MWRKIRSADPCDQVFHCSGEHNRAKPHVYRSRFELLAACRVHRFMFQLINGTIECGECRNEIRHGEEFDCQYCAASICESCIAQHETECLLSLHVKKLYSH